MTSTITAGSLLLDDRSPAVPAVRVEEEFLLLDPRTGKSLPVAGRVTAALPERLRERGRARVRPDMTGLVTGACTDLRDLRHQLTRLRRAAAGAATGAGARLTAIGATPQAEPLALDPALCGLHVRVGVPDRMTAVRVGDHLRIWLPVIRALTVNSPFFAGTDTGHASWRAVQLGHRASVEPVPASPAVDVRVGDVCTDVDDTVVVTALIRAAVATAVTDIAEGLAAPAPRDEAIAAAHRRAARYGLGGELVDLRLGRTRPAWELVDEFFATVSPALLHSGDLTRVVDGLARLRETGDGAARQRRIHRGTGDLRAVLAALAAWTSAA